MRRKTKKILKFLLWTTTIGSFLLILGVAAIFLYFAKDLPTSQQLTDLKISESTKIFDRNGFLLYEVHGEEKRTAISIDRVSQYLKNATVATEDQTFYSHYGIEPKAIIRAAWNTIVNKTTQGGSTITQQFIKNTLLTREKSLTRKIKEVILALEMERRYSKSQILELYLNQIPYGSNSYGIESASRNFLGKDASNLTLAEAAMLAALPRAPTYYSPYGNHFNALMQRKNYILDRMEQLGFITEKEKGQAKNEKIAILPRHEKIFAPHFINYVKEYLGEKYGEQNLERSGFNVYTTLDYEYQKKVEEIVKKYADINLAYNAKNAAVVSLDSRTGQILAMVGSKDYWDLTNDGNFNVVLQPRQPGSSFKPIVYATAFKKGYTPDTKVFDLPTEFAVNNPECPLVVSFDNNDKDCYHPNNYDGKFHGPTSLKNALAQSLNIPAVKVLYLAGIDESIETAKNLGITTLEDRSRFGLSLVLGGGEVKLLEISNAYGAFSQEGNLMKTTPILKIEDTNGKILEEYKQEKKEVLEPQITRLITSVLSDNVARAPAFGEPSPLYFDGYDVAVKTGTTQGDTFDENRDGWTIGYSPSFVVGVWVGNNDNTPFKKRAGVYVAAPIFHEAMDLLLKTKPLEKFNPPDPIQTDKPYLTGQFEEKIIVKIGEEEKTFLKPHDLLYFINPGDPMLKNWETPIIKWAEGKNYSNPINPDDTDNIHPEENQPQITIIEPQENSMITDKIIISTKTNAGFPIKQVDFFLDDLFIGSSASNPYELIYYLKSDMHFEPNSTHTITAKIYDKIGNTNETQINIIIQ